MKRAKCIEIPSGNGIISLLDMNNIQDAIMDTTKGELTLVFAADNLSCTYKVPDSSIYDQIKSFKNDPVPQDRPKRKTPTDYRELDLGETKFFIDYNTITRVKMIDITHYDDPRWGVSFVCDGREFGNYVSNDKSKMQKVYDDIKAVIKRNNHGKVNR